jgi:hypothetical protein
MKSYRNHTLSIGQENGLSLEVWKATSNFQRIILWISEILTFA